MNFCKNLIPYFQIASICGILFLIKLSDSQTILSNYNQPCLHASHCSNQAGLYCIPTLPSGQHRCGCPTNGTIFDEAQGRCVIRLNYPCQGNQTHCPTHSHCAHQDPHHPDLYYYEPRCFCDADYVASKDGKCILAAKYGESCSEGKKCDEVSGGLICTPEGRCGCRFGEDEQYYDLKKSRCISYVSKRCLHTYSCIENARCNISSIRRSRTQTATVLSKDIGGGNIRGGRRINPETGINNIRSNSNDAKNSAIADENSIGTCICEFGFTSTSTGRCLAGYKQICSDQSICNPQDLLTCNDGSCNCISPLHMQYDTTRRKCVSLIGSKCSPTVNCIENATCSNGFCECPRGFSRTPHRTCLLDHNAVCESGQCNRYTGLTCSSNKRCTCMDDALLYNPSTRRCVAALGSPCGHIGQTGDYGKETFFVACEGEPLAICKQEPGGDSSTSFCRLQKDEI